MSCSEKKQIKKLEEKAMDVAQEMKKDLEHLVDLINGAIKPMKELHKLRKKPPQDTSWAQKQMGKIRAYQARRPESYNTSESCKMEPLAGFYTAQASPPRPPPQYAGSPGGGCGVAASPNQSYGNQAAAPQYQSYGAANRSYGNQSYGNSSFGSYGPDMLSPQRMMPQRRSPTLYSPSLQSPGSARMTPPGSPRYAGSPGSYYGPQSPCMVQTTAEVYAPPEEESESDDEDECVC